MFLILLDDELLQKKVRNILISKKTPNAGKIMLLKFKMKFTRCDSYSEVLIIKFICIIYIIFILNNHIFMYNFLPFLEILFINCLWYFVDHIFVCIHQFFTSRKYNTTQIIKTKMIVSYC